MASHQHNIHTTLLHSTAALLGLLHINCRSTVTSLEEAYSPITTTKLSSLSANMQTGIKFFTAVIMAVSMIAGTSVSAAPVTSESPELLKRSPQWDSFADFQSQYGSEPSLASRLKAGEGMMLPVKHGESEDSSLFFGIPITSNEEEEDE
ncbi:hypothetical protein THASP1DRAFT_33508 [Thamnocephalis sphaerospora]|uniref:Uncharacterized protein n=1 Tax=Thamnocephalis sphaerospora TaxID=78915 RepID=A0A4P9XGF6_9FUNG|nr:hypothetical protein THASP1DRAFT_33508 [Thamnocephalis sphaerospora]|eukprot:RKP04692.1 hypothetical protein THASP1DRAFT_33508 [Thamnocephalis sphaerospora]